jgi:putative ABC transport system permease protein
MSLLSRLRNVFRRRQLNAELDEELRLHLEDAIAAGRDPIEARQALGNMLRHREASRDIFVSRWLDNLRGDITFSLRQIARNKITSAAAILSLALAIGATTASFHLIDALFLRPLPVPHPERLHVITTSYRTRTGGTDYSWSCSYPLFKILRAAVKDDAELLSIESSHRIDLTYGSDADMERAYQQRISGWTFTTLGLAPAYGRLFTASDDQTPGAHPVAVISFDYWQTRFGGRPQALGTTFRIGNTRYEIIGVAPKGFTGTETGSPAAIFTTSMMMDPKALSQMGWNWFRPWLVIKPGASLEVVRQKLTAATRAVRLERSGLLPPGSSPELRQSFLNPEIKLLSASAGVSGAQRTYGQALLILGVLVLLLLGIACANVANLMTAQAWARAREMALRVSIGAGRLRLIQLVITESFLIACAASLLGFAFSLWSAPQVMSRINPPDDPLRLTLTPDHRLFLFLILLTFAVTLLFGLAPALRASSVRPSAALKGGEDPHARRRLMHVLIAAQIAFCFIVHFTAGLFFSSYDRLTAQPTGFNSDRLLALSIDSKEPLALSHWDQATARLRQLPGVASVASASWALLSRSNWTNDISVNGANPLPGPPFFLAVSPTWFDTMQIPILEGRHFRPADSTASVAIVNQTFAHKYFPGQNPIGKSFDQLNRDQRHRIEIIGIARDARYDSLAETINATVYIPQQSAGGLNQVSDISSLTFLVRTTAADPLSLAAMLRHEVHAAHPSLRLSNLITQQSLIDEQCTRERLLAILGAFFATVALVLSAVGLYGVLHFTVQQRRRELGIRLALGAQPARLIRHVSLEVCWMLLVGSVSGLALGLASDRFLKGLLFGVKTTDWRMMLLPFCTILLAALMAAILPILRALRIDPGSMLRSE